MIWPLLFSCAVIIALYLTMPLLPAKSAQQKLQISLFIALFIGASLGTYNIIGSPHLSHALFISSPSNANTPNTAPQSTRPAPAPSQQVTPKQITPEQVTPKQVTPEQITAMVNGLAARLADNPEDPDGWTRLIRSRIVLGDMAQLIQDHKIMTQTYADRPEIMETISEQSGFNALVARITEQE